MNNFMVLNIHYSNSSCSKKRLRIIAFLIEPFEVNI